mmetsp:Transcript_33299/g.105457  ORF Transcript_33299/g.105457 Transcript_33299/m.105457 type:complete len:233 (-) Transcript_33299:1562-2260(-)
MPPLLSASCTWAGQRYDPFKNGQYCGPHRVWSLRGVLVCDAQHTKAGSVTKAGTASMIAARGTSCWALRRSHTKRLWQMPSAKATWTTSSGLIRSWSQTAKKWAGRGVTAPATAPARSTRPRSSPTSRGCSSRATSTALAGGRGQTPSQTSHRSFSSRASRPRWRRPSRASGAAGRGRWRPRSSNALAGASPSTHCSRRSSSSRCCRRRSSGTPSSIRSSTPTATSSWRSSS